ncbi:hypothetical protein [Chamaesiphon minutus]|uniref:Uncharacterized protein n=1 Tax=Chamaesiphon minutus (strain ATCC 27169 / PCC 6605) TaxID=1173020 RepID=K9UDZ6_CHAP6|nr:hypothetical protein [Chamaesiphon minutus]AFY92853.1 hypothetical protein Cha6605_1728 [Chamaesiphon minutus PCC 6605]
MLKFAEFDIKTGRPILQYDPITDGQIQSYKEVDIAYLQHWLRARGLERAPLYTADFYEGINPSDNERLLKQGKHVIFTGGTSGKYVSAYFTDSATAQAILIGNEREPPLYELGDKSAHYAVAYGSLPISDCYKDAIVKGGNGRKILIIDDEAQSVGSVPLTDRDGKPVKDVGDLLGLMGDGTMLLPTGLMRELLLEKEVSAIIRRGIVRVASANRTDHDLNAELGVVGEWLDEVTGDKVEDELVALIAAEYRANGRIGTSHVHLNTAKTINKLLDRAADESVIQFRAAITDTPGMFKGMMKTSKWCERLGVAAIVSKNCIKGNGVDLDTVGILELNKGSTLWIGRKEVATWGEQSVGMQVKICIPTATERELNPLALARAGQLTEIAVDPYLLGQKYIEDDRRKKSNLVIVIDDNGEVSGQVRQKDALADLLVLDVNGELTQMPTIQRRLTEALRTSWIDAATSGVEVPSAVAQHHGKLDVWEICNRKLPHGAVVAFYRSPVPNVSAFALGVNNLDLKDVDPESYNKRGVVYVNPWTAKEIAISDFDGDRFGQFVGYIAKDPNAFIAALREVVSASQSPSRRYEAFHAALAQSIELGTDFELGTFPLSVDELAVATSLEHRPQQIKKATKKPHRWEQSQNQPISEAIFTAWTNVAANPISKVANLGMNLQMLAQNAINTPANEKAVLLNKIGTAFEKLKAIPSNDVLINAGLPALDLQAGIDRVTALNHSISPLERTTPERQIEVATTGLAQVAKILKDYAEYPVASQLQVAVDSLKSSNGINEDLFKFGLALCYQKNEVRAELKADWVYSIDKSPPRGLSTVLPANTYEPIGEHVRAVNDIFESVLQAQRDIKIGREDLNAAFRQIVPLIHNPQDSLMVDGYVSQYRAARDILGVATARQNEQRFEDKQPTLTITSANSGKTFEVHRTIQAQNKNTLNKNRVWELEPSQVYRFSIEKNLTARADPYLVNLIDANDNKIAILGSTAHEMLEQGNFELEKLDAAMEQRGAVKLQGRVELHPPRMMINDTDRHKAVMTQVLANLKAAISPEREDAALSAIWYGNQSTDRRVRNSSAGMSIATKILPDRLGDYLGAKRTLDLGHVTEYGGILADANTTLDLRIDNLIKKEGAGAVPMVSAILPDGSTVELGSILKSAPPPPPGSIIAGTVTRKVRDIDIVVGNEKRKVIPTAELTDAGLIDRTAAKFAFRVNVGGVEVSTIHGDSMTVLGTLVPKSRDRTDTIPSSNEGTYERTFHSHQIEVHVREFVAHQPVSDILSGEPIVLQREINPNLPPLQTPRHQPPPPERYVPNRAEIVGWYKAAIAIDNADDTRYLTQIGQQLKAAYMGEPFMQGQPRVEILPDDYHHATVAISIEDKQRLDSMHERPSPSYCPTRADVVQWYKAAVKVADAPNTQYLMDLGTQLKTAYLNEPFMQGRATVEQLPDEYQNSAVSISMADKQRLDAMSERANEPQPQIQRSSRSR